MRRRRVTPPQVRLFLLLLVGVLAFSSGCGQPDYYPDTGAQTPVGKAGECASCGAKIAEISEDNLTTIQGIQYVVCDEKCAAKQEEWVRSH